MQPNNTQSGLQRSLFNRVQIYRRHTISGRAPSLSETEAEREVALDRTLTCLALADGARLEHLFSTILLYSAPFSPHSPQLRVRIGVTFEFQRREGSDGDLRKIQRGDCLPLRQSEIQDCWLTEEIRDRNLIWLL